MSFNFLVYVYTADVYCMSVDMHLIVDAVVTLGKLTYLVGLSRKQNGNCIYYSIWRAFGSRLHNTCISLMFLWYFFTMVCVEPPRYVYRILHGVLDLRIANSTLTRNTFFLTIKLT